MNSRFAFTLVLFVTCAAFGLAAEPRAKPEPVKENPFEVKLLEIGKDYKGLQLVDGTGRWAPELCRPPKGPPDAHFSKSGDEKTHGKKLYLMYAKNVKKGVYVIDEAAAVGQIIVKESWKPEACAPEDLKNKPSFKEYSRGVPSAKKDGKTYYATEKHALFVMMKLDPKTADTDEGWVYATLAPDGKTVTSAGKLESCMKCHQKAENDRLFGLPKKEEK